MDRRILILYDRRVRLGNGQTDQLRLYDRRRSSAMGRLSGSPAAITQIIRALAACPTIRLEALGSVPPTEDAA